jgi:HAD superfamily hydrolase (TIGR01459 family)
MKWISGLREIASGYRHMLVDVYGVLHDGGVPFDLASEALAEARTRGIRIVILTNSSGRAEAVKGRLAAIGVDESRYEHVVSSGELSWRHLNAINACTLRLPSVRAIREAAWPGWIDELPNPRATHVGEADYFVVAGMPYRTESDFLASEDELRVALARDLPMVVADSDETYPSCGIVRLGPGWLGRRFSDLGGKTIEFGKPHAPVYDEALRLLGDPDPASVLMIGDNLKTDMAGATAAGTESLLVLDRGVHLGQPIDAVRAQAAEMGAMPTWAIDELRW